MPAIDRYIAPTGGLGTRQKYRRKVRSPALGFTAPPAPVIANVSPAAGTAIDPNTPIEFDLTSSAAIRLTLLRVKYAASGRREIVIDDDGFTPEFSASTRTAISGGYHYTLRRTGGWPSAPTLIPDVVDTYGSEVA